MPTHHWIEAQVILVLFLATLVRSAFGFGEALISVPLLALLMPIEVAAPTAVLVSITVALVIVIHDHGDKLTVFFFKDNSSIPM